MPKNTKTKSPPRNPAVPQFLKELLDARSPSGYEEEAREVVRKKEFLKLLIHFQLMH